MTLIKVKGQIRISPKFSHAYRLYLQKVILINLNIKGDIRLGKYCGGSRGRRLSENGGKPYSGKGPFRNLTAAIFAVSDVPKLNFNRTVSISSLEMAPEWSRSIIPNAAFS